MQLCNDEEALQEAPNAPTISMESVSVINDAICTDAHRLVRIFYDVLLRDPDAAIFLSEEAVEMRLSHSLREWLLDLFRDAEDVEWFVARQRQIGEVHARIKIPFRLLMMGAALLKKEISALLVQADLAPKILASSLISLDARMDWAIGLMSEAYMQGSLRRAQIDEAFRLFAVGQDMSLERETQHAALMDWLQSVLFPLLDERSDAELRRLSSAPFGLWFHHRAGLMFPRAPGLEAIESNMRLIDQVLLPQLQGAKRNRSADFAEILARLQARVEEVRFVLGDMFQDAASIDGGRDPLTRVLNRRFLPTILGREISISRQTATPFTLLMVDVDHFKQINDQWGHSTGDLVLQQVADVIMNSVRLNDFVFRYGGEEFLIGLVETGVSEGYEIAERLRLKLAERELRLTDGTGVLVTASIGIAGFDGHPDYIQLVEAADRALYRAKQSGRNQSVIAGELSSG